MIVYKSPREYDILGRKSTRSYDDPRDIHSRLNFALLHQFPPSSHRHDGISADWRSI